MIAAVLALVGVMVAVIAVLIGVYRMLHGK